MGVSKNNDTPKSSILIGFSLINHPFWDTTIFGNTHIYIYPNKLKAHGFLHPGKNSLGMKDLIETYLKMIVWEMFVSLFPGRKVGTN